MFHTCIDGNSTVCHQCHEEDQAQGGGCILSCLKTSQRKRLFAIHPRERLNIGGIRVMNAEQGRSVKIPESLELKCVCSTIQGFR